MTFPEGEFPIRNRASGRVLDVQYASTDSGTSVIAWEFKGDEDSSNQRWRFEDNHLINVNSGLALTFNCLDPESLATQEERNGSEGQRFEYEDGTIRLADRDDLVVGEWEGDVKIVVRDENDNARRWDF
ncbi:Ricin B-related lectin [Cordyceps militaris CM01]|uniref:Ricin B-related lectin n=2 Tax=Cordyceps militaris TaxID=73501 RepID=G3JGU5_CORMM|nr:Ricin B-related lectin [Cordyceps militaris CM01]ATY66967.1 Ricin B-related lectin [Cordyceps militaris]EGX92459.1 Ricin B-related lectin [Cordyceps militaris CM01]